MKLRHQCSNNKFLVSYIVTYTSTIKERRLLRQLLVSIIRGLEVCNLVMELHQ